MSEALARTPLHDLHSRLGARLVPFAGWEMPVQYEGVIAEHRAVREGAGVFDVSHMGQIETAGRDAERLLQLLITNDVTALEVGGAQYGCLCREDGGVLDDLFSYRIGPDRYLTVTNASNHERDLAWFREHAAELDVEVRDASPDTAMLAVQGPAARAAVAPLVDGDLPRRMRCAELRVRDRPALVCGTGYTGEDGVEILLDPEDAPGLFADLVDAGVRPAGLGARDTLRLEVCFHLYGNELSTDRTPIEAGLGWVCKEETAFIGSGATAKVREEGPAERLVAFQIRGRGIPRQGNTVLAGGQRAGVVTSGTMSPMLERGIGMAYVRSDLAEPGTALEIDVRGKVRPAHVEQKPLWKKQN